MVRDKDIIKYIWNYLDGTNITAIGEEGRFCFAYPDGEEYYGTISVRIDEIEYPEDRKPFVDDPEEVKAFVDLANRSVEGDSNVLPADNPHRLLLGFIDISTEKLHRASLSLLKREHPELLKRIMEKRGMR